MNKRKLSQKPRYEGGRRVAGANGPKGAPRIGKPSSPTADGTRPPLGVPTGEVRMYIDGGARGNPGPAACAVIARGEDGTTLTSFSKSLGQATNNQAEYEALLAALQYARGQDFKRVKVLSDSQLVVRQIQGTYRVKNPDLKILRYRACQIIAELVAFSIVQVPREELREVDRLIVQALDDADLQAASGQKNASQTPG